MRARNVLAVCAAGATVYGCNGGVLAFIRSRHSGVTTQTRTLAIDPAGVTGLRLDVKVGSLRVTALGSGAIDVRAIRRVRGGTASQRADMLKLCNVVIARHGGTLEVRDVVPAHTGLVSSDLDLVIHSPANLRLEENTGVGDAELSGIVSDAQVAAGVGDVSLRQLVCTGHQASAHTGTGDVVAELRTPPRVAFDANVGIGDATVKLAPQAQAQISMTTGVGGVRSDLPLSERVRSRNLTGGALRGQLGHGGPAVRISIGTGDASVAALEATR